MASFSVVAAACRDSFLLAKFEFFKTIALALEPFLRKYQSPKPMTPFLYDDLVNILQLLYRRFLKTSIVDEAKSNIKKLMAIQLTDPKGPEYLAVPKIDIGKFSFLIIFLEQRFHCSLVGFVAKSKMPKDASELQKYNFYAQCQLFLMKVTSKIIERCPLKYGLVRGLSSLKPATVKTSTTVSQQRFDICLASLLKANRITTSIADLAKAQFSLLSSSKTALDKMKNFNESSDRLDSFWFSLIGMDDDYGAL